MFAILSLTKNIKSFTGGVIVNSEKMMKGAKTLDTIVKVVRGIAGAMVWVLAIFSVLVAVVGEKVFVPDSLTLELGFIKVLLADEYQRITPMMRLYASAVLVSGAVYAFAIRYLTGIVRAILAPMKEGRPFETGVCASLKKIAYWIFITGGISQVLGAVCSVLMTRSFPIDAVFSSEAVKDIGYVQVMDFGFVLAGFVALFLSWVFAYGQALQKEADETL